MEPEPHNIFQKQLKRVYEQYQKDLFANNALDFGEIICMPYRLLRDNPDLREKYQKRFRYIHVDEYQDTNRAQYFLLSMLAGKTQGGHQNICVVGDEDQSIYKWRGADIRNIMDFETDFPGAQVVKLEQNYRSTKTIIEAATHVIKNNKYRKDKTLWTDNEDGVPIVHVQLPDERAEAELVVSEIKRIAQNEGRVITNFRFFTARMLRAGSSKTCSDGIKSPIKSSADSGSMIVKKSKIFFLSESHFESLGLRSA